MLSFSGQMTSLLASGTAIFSTELLRKAPSADEGAAKTFSHVFLADALPGLP